MAAKNKLIAFTLLTLFLFPISSRSGEFSIPKKKSIFPIDYTRYGQFEGIGTNDYRFKITDLEGLKEAMGGGLFPADYSSLKEIPAFKEWNETKPANISPWDFVNTDNPIEDFFVWASASSQPPANKLFFAAEALVQAGQYEWAIKAYYALLIHFPKVAIASSDQTFFWYPAKVALGKIESLTKHHPEIGYQLLNAEFKIKNEQDPNKRNHKFIINPGTWAPYNPKEKVNLKKLKVIQTRGTGRVHLVQYENGHWQLIVDGKPMVVKGVTYQPTKVGRDISDKQGNSWMSDDENENGFPDAPFDSWVDENKNNQQDDGEEAVGDFQLMADMGANAIRVIHLSSSLDYEPDEFDKETLRTLYEKFGLMTIMTDYLGAYTLGSGATWAEGTDYTNKTQLKNMKRMVRAYVLDHKDEPYVLMWVLGNENLMPSDYSGVNATRTMAAEQVREYLMFVNEIAEMIHKLDPDHPVAVGNLGSVHLEEHAKYAPAVDIFGVNSYLGEYGFGDLWKRVRKDYDRPVMLTEFGCDAYDSKQDQEDERAQAVYHQGNWKDINLNLAGHAGEGNAIGGVVFEFIDEWWKSQKGPQNKHDAVQDSAMAFPDGWSSEEWFGLVSQGNGKNSPFMRQLREAYYFYKDEWGR